MPSSSDSITPFSIPGNIKQQFLPFLLNPSAAIDNPQLFTYKNKVYGPGGTASLGFYPSTSFPDANNNSGAMYGNKSGALDKDVSFKLLYGSKDNTKQLKLDDIISTLPGISIREFLPDTRLDQCLNFFKDMFSKMSEVMTSAKDVGGKTDIEKQSSNLMEKIWNCAKYAIGYMTGQGTESFLSDAFADSDLSKNMKDNATAQLQGNAKLKKYVHDFPFILYYRLQSCTTTNIYEVPAICEGKPVLQSDGKPGWGDGSDFMGAGVSGLLNKIPLVGQIAEMVLGNIGINYMPWWNAESGAKVAAPEVNIKFDLFNDNVMKAMQNFIFVNTIVPSNKWIQYNMFQHSSNLYDVKIEGLNRLFACAASFDVTYDGVLRNPSEEFYKRLEGHVNENYGGKAFVKNGIKANNLIKIPDIYRVNMTFKSLLPANFNNFMYTYTQNMNHMTNLQVKTKGLGENFGKGIATFADRIKDVWNGGNGSNESTYTEQDPNQPYQ